MKKAQINNDFQFHKQATFNNPVLTNKTPKVYTNGSAMEQPVLDTNAGKQLSYAATDF
jgi:hypothetical protein